MAELFDLSEREVGILVILARSSHPLSMRDISRLRLEGWNADRVNAQALNRLVGSGLLERIGSNRATFTVTSKGLQEAKRRSSKLFKPSGSDGSSVEHRLDDPASATRSTRAVALFDPAKFGRRIAAEIHLRNMTFDQVGGAIGRSGAAVNQIVKGKHPGVETFLRLLHWCGETQISVEAFRIESVSSDEEQG